MLHRFLRWPALIVVIVLLGAAMVVGWCSVPAWRHPFIFGRLVTLSAVIIAISALWLTMRRQRRPDERPPWVLLLVTLSLLAGGHLAAPVVDLFHRILPSAWITTLFVAGHLLLAFVLIWRSGKYPRTFAGIAAICCDQALVIGALGVLVYAAGLAPTFIAADGVTAPRLYAVCMLLVVMALGMQMSTQAPAYQTGPRRLRWAAVALLLLGDAIGPQVPLLPWVDAFPLALLLWTLAYPLFGVAGLWECANRQHDAREAHLDGADLIFLGTLPAALLFAAAMLPLLRYGETLFSGPDGPVIMRLTVLLAILALTQLGIFMLRSRQAYRQLLTRLHASEEMAVTDALTSLPNKRFLTQRMTEELSRAKRYQRPVAVIFADIDFFKLVNDVYGHHVGDQVLCAFGNKLQEMVRTTDVVARLGGEEFVLLLPETTLGQAGILAERLRRAVEDMRMRVPGDYLRITASFGMAAYPETSDTTDSLLQDADEAMNHAKESGRNRVIPARAKQNLYISV